MATPARDARGRFVKSGASKYGMITVDMSEYEAFFARLKEAGNGDFEKELKGFLEGLGEEFLRIIEDEIIRMGAVDTRLLLNSFHKGGGENIWELSNGGLTLTVGTNVEYAQWVNDGHMTTRGGSRFVPGTWSGDRFTYSPGASTGMLLRHKWVEGYHYWESGLAILEQMVPDFLETKVQEWMNRYFGMF